MKRFAFLLLAAAPAVAQHNANNLNIGARFAATEANSPPGACGCFWLTGAAADAALPLLPRISAVVEVAGQTTAKVPGTTRGLSEITLLAGPRYTLPLRHLNLNAQALFGAARGFDSDFVLTPTSHKDTSTNFSMALGGSLDLPLTRTLTLRAAQLDYLQTNLPNGQDNRQRNLRVGAGLVFNIPLPTSRKR